MAYIFKKKVRGQTCWYLGENKKINRVSRRVWQKYLGNSKTIKDKLGIVTEPVEIDVLEFGCVSSLLSLNKEIDFINVADKILTKREQGLSYGEHLFLTIINRIDNPKSRSKLGEWFNDTVLKKHFSVKSSYLSSQDFWNHWNNIEEENINYIQEKLLQKIIPIINIKELVYDPTNFTTYIEEHKQNKIPNFGRAKDKSKGFRQVNLSLLVTKEEGIPLWHHTYPGNINDVTEFKELIKSLTTRIKFFAKKCKKIIIIFDKGNNSKNNIKNVDKKLSFFIVGSLKPSEHLELFDAPLKEFKEEYLTAKEKRVIYTSKIIDLYEGKKKIVVTYSEELAYKNKLRVEKALNKALNQLKNIQGKLNNSRSSRDELLIKVSRIADKSYIKGLIDYEINEDKGNLSLSYQKNDQMYKKISKQFGKNILFTDDLSMKPVDVVKLYNEKHIVEEQIKCLKDKYVISFTPMWCWTDKMIRIHAFTCVISLLFLRLLMKKVKDAKINLSEHQTIEQLKKIKLAILKLPNSEKLVYKITRLNDNQRKLVNLFNLREYQ